MSRFQTGTEEGFIRLHGADNQIGGWVVKKDAIRGLTPTEIQSKYALPTVPTHASDVIVPKGTTMEFGTVNPGFPGARWTGTPVPPIRATRSVCFPKHEAITMTTYNSVLTTKDGKLEISGRQIETEFPVAQAIKVNSNIVARLEVPAGSVMNSNVLCFSEDGDLLWMIEASPYGGTSDDPYIAIALSESSSIIARTWNGVEFEVSLADGSVKPIGLRRF